MAISVVKLALTAMFLSISLCFVPVCAEDCSRLFLLGGLLCLAEDIDG